MKSCCDEYCSTHGCNQGRDCPVRIARIRDAKSRLDRDEWRVWTWIARIAVVLGIAWLWVMLYLMHMSA